MNILFITPYYSSTSSGGIESEVKTLSQSLSDSNHCVVIGPKLGKDEVSLENEVTIYRTQLVNPLADIKPRTKDCIDFFQKVIGQERIDKILAHNLHMWVHPSVVTSLVSVAADKDIPVYLRIHNSGIFRITLIDSSEGYARQCFLNVVFVGLPVYIEKRQSF